MRPTHQCPWRGIIEGAVEIWRMKIESLLVSLPFRRLSIFSYKIEKTLNLTRKISILFELL